jgi:hypothetical protein
LVVIDLWDWRDEVYIVDIGFGLVDWLNYWLVDWLGIICPDVGILFLMLVIL